MANEIEVLDPAALVRILGAENLDTTDTDQPLAGEVKQNCDSDRSSPAKAPKITLKHGEWREFC